MLPHVADADITQRCCSTTIGATRIDVVDPVAIADFMEQLLILLLSVVLLRGFALFRCDARCNRPHAREIFEKFRGPAGTHSWRSSGSFGETSPDPIRLFPGLVSALCRVGGLISVQPDGDGDRYLIWENGFGPFR